ncbi:MAG: GTPase domain-containing protein [Deltaproteobacteria bacterium]|nr:GTPase domain-containing protein [Deltaproteobacteria bacterium]MBW2362138.1 GTPase domain-containing protein [Deltaproteobacteria bacterium]
MTKVSRESDAVNARIVYWGIQGAGKTENLIHAHQKLRPDHRGEITNIASRLDPSVTYEELPISLGEVGGVKTQLEMIAVPGGHEQGPMRKQLLDQVDGVVLVVDAAAGVDENIASLEELREALAAYGRALEDVPLVLQYNKRDIADPYALDDLHRKLHPGDAPVFEAVASEGTGVLQTLSTISKRVIRHLREHGTPLAPPAPAVEPVLAAEPMLAPEPVPAPEPAPVPEFAAAPSNANRMEDALAAEGTELDAPGLDLAADEAETLLEKSFSDFSGEIERPAGARLGPDVSIVSVGEATRTGERSLRVPLVLGDAEGGTSTLVLSIQLDALVEGDPG